MTSPTREPMCASDLASLAAETLNQLLALATSIVYLHGRPGCHSSVNHLARLAEMHALEWAENFEEEVALHRDLTDEKKGGQA